MLRNYEWHWRRAKQWLSAYTTVLQLMPLYAQQSRPFIDYNAHQERTSRISSAPNKFWNTTESIELTEAIARRAWTGSTIAIRENARRS